MHQAMNTPETERAEMFDVEGAARFLGVSVDFLNRRRMRGREEQGPPFMRVGRKVRYRKVDLQGWLAAQVVNPLN